MPVLRLELDELTVHAVTDATDLQQIRRRISRAQNRQQTSEHRTPTGGWLLIQWRNIALADVALAPGEPDLAAPASEVRPA